MTLYDEIKNTFDENKILEILKLYCNNNDNLYNTLVYDQDFQDSTTSIYKTNFLHYIQNPYIEELYSALKKYDLELTDKNISEYIEKVKKRTDLTTDQIKDTIDSVERYWLYPLSEFKEIFNKFNSYEELLQFLEKNNFSIIAKDLENIALFPNNPKELNKAKENIKNKVNLTNEELEELLLINKLKSKLRNKFWGGEGIMGFHVNKARINPSDETNQRIDIKFYINVGTDSYQFANIFREKCKKQNIDYAFKVADAYRHKEYKRTDKICIWSSYEDAERIVNVLKEIKKEHPEFNYQKPPLLCGTIDDFIGVGQDFNSSFNHGMSRIIKETINNILGTNNKQEILKIISTNPNKLTEIKNEIKRIAKTQGLDSEKMCVQKNTKEMLEVFNDNKPHCIQKDDKFYINRAMYEYAVKNNITIEGTPKVIGGKNFYEITQEQLKELKNSYNNTNNSTNTSTSTNTNNSTNTSTSTNTNTNTSTSTNTNNNIKQKKNIKINIPITYINNVLYIPDKYCFKKNKNHIKIENTLYTAVTEDELAKLKQQLSTNGIDVVLQKKVVKKKITDERYIPGTNILKPRNRGLYETDKEYEKYLEEYYNSVFNKNTTSNKKEENTNNNKTIIIYHDKLNNKLYIKEEDSDYKNESTAIIINKAKCFEINEEDLNKINRKISKVSVYLKLKDKNIKKEQPKQEEKKEEKETFVDTPKVHTDAMEEFDRVYGEWTSKEKRRWASNAATIDYDRTGDVLMSIVRKNSNDKDFMMYIVNIDAYFIKEASKEIMNDIDFAKLAYRKNPEMAKRYLNEEIIKKIEKENMLQENNKQEEQSIGYSY